MDGIEHAQNFVEIAAGAHGVAQHQFDLLIRTYDEDGANRGVGGGGAALGGVARIGRQHVVELGDLKLRVADHGEGDLVALGFFDVAGPFAVAGNRVYAQADNLTVAACKLGRQSGHVAELGGADGRKILGMGEQNRPSVADPFVKVDGTLSGIGREIRRRIVDSK